MACSPSIRPVARLLSSFRAPEGALGHYGVAGAHGQHRVHAVGDAAIEQLGLEGGIIQKLGVCGAAKIRFRRCWRTTLARPNPLDGCCTAHPQECDALPFDRRATTRVPMDCAPEITDPPPPRSKSPDAHIPYRFRRGDDREQWNEGTGLIHNPFAQFPLPVDWLGSAAEIELRDGLSSASALRAASILVVCARLLALELKVHLPLLFGRSGESPEITRGCFDPDR